LCARVPESQTGPRRVEEEMRGNAVNHGNCNKTAGSTAVAGDARRNCCQLTVTDVT
jgi:hypothetical protein